MESQPPWGKRQQWGLQGGREASHPPPPEGAITGRAGRLKSLSIFLPWQEGQTGFSPPITSSSDWVWQSEQTYS